jgi:CheY-like chemotaxis protein
MNSDGWFVPMNAMAPRPPAVSKCRILVVEDDATLGQALCRILAHAGYEAVFSADFRSALQVLEGEQPIDLLLTDIVMPNGVNGLALARMARLRRHHLKVIYLTGYTIPGVDEEALGPVLRKPIDDRVLIQEIERSLATKSESQEGPACASP